MLEAEGGSSLSDLFFFEWSFLSSKKRALVATSVADDSTFFRMFVMFNTVPLSLGSLALEEISSCSALYLRFTQVHCVVVQVQNNALLLSNFRSVS